MTIYDLLAITVTGAVGFVLGVVTTIKVDDTHERIKHKGRCTEWQKPVRKD